MTVIVQGLVQTLVFLVLQLLTLFVSAGRCDIVEFWLYIVRSRDAFPFWGKYNPETELPGGQLGFEPMHARRHDQQSVVDLAISSRTVQQSNRRQFPSGKPVLHHQPSILRARSNNPICCQSYWRHHLSSPIFAHDPVSSWARGVGDAEIDTEGGRAPYLSSAL